MKTILVPTDFSPSATNAANYALEVARKVKANIKLCNAIKVPEEAVMAAQVVWPMPDADDLKDKSDAELNYLVTTLERQLDNQEEGFRPHIHHTTGFGDVTDFVRNLVSDDDVNLVVMGMSGANVFSRFALGSNSRELISKAGFPLLLVPKAYKYRPIKKIAFATDLSEADIDILQSLAGFARYYNAEILISHVLQVPDQDQKLIDSFLSDVTCKVDYPNIYYRSLQSTGVNEGLQWLTENGIIDMIVMVHRNNSFFNSHSQKLAVNTKVPLMVLPGEFNKFLL
ncbi:universal stress protein [Mucilaginibacter terrenus]|uniref:Universal stress protein n=1 Tax=Mucilaginibacter terrenus TaxID=2482727 RepID=A0A3E2NWH0_9SPHI|nr:universal stress protein [Mucilaginibacter terrenus]RFZ85307.1 universal stress protein [Mucilaginibacter terrenus]